MSEIKKKKAKCAAQPILDGFQFVFFVRFVCLFIPVKRILVCLPRLSIFVYVFFCFFFGRGAVIGCDAYPSMPAAFERYFDE